MFCLVGEMGMLLNLQCHGFGYIMNKSLKENEYFS